jgi:ribosome-associated protein
MARVPAEIRVSESVRVPGSEIALSYARSGGPGGQHVNRTSSKVLLRWSLDASRALTVEQVDRLRTRLASRLTAEGDLLLTSDRHRDQARNVADVLERFVRVLREGLRRPRVRKATRPTRASQERRLVAKRRRSERKRDRRPDE